MKNNSSGIKIKKPRAIAEAMALLGSGKRSFLAIQIEIRIEGSMAHSKISMITYKPQSIFVIAKINGSAGFAKQ